MLTQTRRAWTPHTSRLARPAGWIPPGLAVCLGVIYAFYSVQRHERLGSAGFDLGIFDQAIRSYSHLHGPIAPLKGPGFNLLGDHFHPIIATLTPFYWLWPDVRMLLVAQAVLLAVSAVPIGALALRRLGPVAGSAVTVAYGLSWGLQGALGFDFHEIAFGVPLLAFSLTALADRRWRAAVCWAAPLVLVKEDLGLTVSAIGIYLLLRGQRRLGLWVVAGGLAALAFVICVAIPCFSPSGHYRYWGYLSQGGGSDDGMLHNLVNLPVSLVEHPAKLTLLLFLLAVSGFAALRSPLLVVAVPIVGYRLVSGNPLYWSTGPVHYNALLMPIVFVALVDGLCALRSSQYDLVRRYAALVPAAALVFALAVLPRFSLWALAHPGYYSVPRHAVAAEHVLAMIPDGATVAAGDYLAPQITDRCTVYLFPDPSRRVAGWVVVDTHRLGSVHATPAQQWADLQALPSQGYRQIADRDGVVLYQRG
jgi:uncharacterized membrane protein